MRMSPRRKRRMARRKRRAMTIRKRNLRRWSRS